MEDIESLYIYDKSQKNSITFTKAIPLILPNGKDGYLFISEKTLPLKEIVHKQLSSEVSLSHADIIKENAIIKYFLVLNIIFILDPPNMCSLQG